MGRLWSEPGGSRSGYRIATSIISTIGQKTSNTNLILSCISGILAGTRRHEGEVQTFHHTDLVDTDCCVDCAHIRDASISHLRMCQFGPVAMADGGVA